MGLIFRGTKGTPLTHNELDNNFREFYYSASYSGNVITLHKSQSNAEPFRLPYPTASGYDTYIQLKSGNNESGSNEFLTSSPNFRFNYSSSILHVTGTYEHKGNVNINGVLTAQQYVTTLVSSSVVYTSGSTQFGDTADDLHSFTGKVYVEGSQQLVGPLTQSGNQLITGDQLFTGEKIHTGQYQLAGNLNQTGDHNHQGNEYRFGFLRQTGSIQLLGNSELNGDLNVSKNVEIENDLEVGNNISITGSLHTTGNQTTLGTITGNSSTFFGDNLTETHTFTGSVNITGSVTANYFIGDGSQVLNVISSSYAVSSSHALTASYAENAASFPYTGSAEITGSLSVIGTVTGTSFAATGGVGVPTLTSANNIILSASNYVQVKDAFLKLNSFTNTETGSYSPTNGDIYYNSSTNLFMGYRDGAWIAFESQGAGLASILEDTTPQLGGNLDLNSNNISGSGNINTVGSLTLTGNITAAQITGSTLNTSGAITAGGDITAFFSSDERLKDNITPLSDAINKINQIGGYEFDWNSDSSHSGHDVGVIAQEIEKVLPEVVTTRDNGYMAVRYEKIVALLIQAVKEQQLQIDELKSKL